MLIRSVRMVGGWMVLVLVRDQPSVFRRAIINSFIYYLLFCRVYWYFGYLKTNKVHT